MNIYNNISVGLVGIFLLIVACNEGSRQQNSQIRISSSESSEESITIDEESADAEEGRFTSVNIQVIDLRRQKIKLGHHVNTAANEYLPVLSSDGKKLFFSAMDRTGFFDFKIDFTQQRSSGGEDIFFSQLEDGTWSDARPFTQINTSSHEVLSQAFKDGSFLVTANYPEKLGPKGENAGVQTTDIFLIKYLKGDKMSIQHFPEPVNSIYSEADGWMAADGSYILFVSDRPGHVGAYHKKGWKWNNSFWGNTDVYISFMNGDYWSVPINLGSKINTAGAERTPWISADGFTLFVSSNGFYNEKTDLDVFAFKRISLTDWDNWDGPYLVADASSDFDDWGYKEKKDGDAFFASVTPLGFKPTQGGAAGDAGIRETNFRTGYEVFGQQIASLNSENTSNIYFLTRKDLPLFTLPDVFFQFDSYFLNKKFTPALSRIVDVLQQNNGFNIEINGYTDDIGSDSYNLELSKKRAESVKSFFRDNGVKYPILVNGFGKQSPKFSNSDLKQKQKNRRVEIFLKKQ
jgi:outer membrane protein OmpA-like peptidoglycan-associated protein